MIENTASTVKESKKSLPSSAKKGLTLKQILLDEPELRGFFRYVKRYDLRLKALAAIEKRLYLPSMN